MSKSSHAYEKIIFTFIDRWFGDKLQRSPALRASLLNFEDCAKYAGEVIFMTCQAHFDDLLVHMMTYLNSFMWRGARPRARCAPYWILCALNQHGCPRVICRTSPSRLRWMLVMILSAIARRVGFRYGLLYCPQFVPFKARSYHRNLTKK